jgi:SAM-dependent methyltransferase
MGRFDTVANTYASFRQPYPPAFFGQVAEELGLKGQEALIDLGTGPGLLALGFSRYVGRILGVDPEPAMVREARRAAAAAQIEFSVVEGRAEDLSADVGPFDLVTIGRALHWMDRTATLAAFERILAPGGRIIICGCESIGSEVNHWRPTWRAVLSEWETDTQNLDRPDREPFFGGSRFYCVSHVQTGHSQVVTPRILVERALTLSSTSPAALGPRIDAFRTALSGALAPFFPEGEACEMLVAWAWIFARRPTRPREA